MFCAGVLLAGCARHGEGRPAPAPRPQVRNIEITAVPVLVKEQEKQFPFLSKDFARGGVLEGKEVYAFVPSTIVAVQGDTLHLSVLNPEDDPHTLVLPGLRLDLPGQQVTHAVYVTGQAGVFTFTCDIPAHAPMMWGQLVVLSPASVGAR